VGAGDGQHAHGNTTRTTYLMIKVIPSVQYLPHPRTNMNDLTPAQQLAMLANSPDGEAPAPPTLKTMSIRLPFDLLAQIDALNSVTGVQSRNSLMIALLLAGVYAVVQELDDQEQYQAALEHFQDEYLDNEQG
jgi:hypothetical protein